MTFSGVLLAGGESRRMGRDKATIVFEGRPLWERQLQVLEELYLKRVFVSARSALSWLPPEVELVLDEPPSRGPLSGLTKALSSMKTTHLVALAIDMPFMTSKQMKLLSGQAALQRGVVPVIEARAEPLAAVYPRESALHFVAALAGDDFSLQPLVQKLVRANQVQLVTVGEEERDLYRSLNEPADLPGGAV